MNELIDQLLSIIGDYSMSQGLVMNAKHIERWINQFSEQYRETILIHNLSY